MEEQGSVGRERRLVERDPGRGLWRCGVQAGRQKFSVSSTQEVEDQGWSVPVQVCMHVRSWGAQGRRKKGGGLGGAGTPVYALTRVRSWDTGARMAGWWW